MQSASTSLLPTTTNNFAYPTRLRLPRTTSQPEALLPQTYTRDHQQPRPHKVPGPDGIPNVMLKRCADTIIGHLYYLFKAITELDVYHPSGLESITCTFRKAGKAAYDIASAYWPIGLLNTLIKLHSTLSANHLSFLAEKHHLLPSTQFGGRAGRNTSDAMHMVTQVIQNAWRTGKVAAVLFLDVQSAFPNTGKEQLIHNMCARKVPTSYIRLTERLLTNQVTRIRIDDYTSEPIKLNNRTTQGCPLSMLFYVFYNALLMEIAKSRHEYLGGFVNNTMFLAIHDNMGGARMMLREMMERPNGGFHWSDTHSSLFQLTKCTVMEFVP